MFLKGASKFANEKLPVFLRSSKICWALDFVELLIVNITTGLLTKDRLPIMKWPGSSCSSIVKRLDLISSKVRSPDHYKQNS